MGRWAQRRVRGGGAEGTNPAPPPQVTAVIIDSNNLARVLFSAPVTLATSAPDTDLTIGVDGSSFQTQTGATEISLHSGVNTWVAGDPWTLATSPAWVAETVVAPDSGTTV